MSDTGSDHEHWPNDFKMRNEPTLPAEGYDSHNGLRSHDYVPAAEKKEPTPPASPAKAIDPRTVAFVHPAQLQAAHMPFQYAYPTQPYPVHYAQPYAQPQRVYYSYATPSPAPVQTPAQVPMAVPTNNGVSYTYYPAGMTPATGTGSNPWQGRTKEEVDEDNQKIAAAEKAYDMRKMVPTGMADDQMCWVVETDGSHTLRTFVAINDLQGGWKKDPRYEDSWYFVMEKKEDEKK